MRFVQALAAFVLAAVIGFGVSSYRGAGVEEFMHIAATCEIAKIAKAKGVIAAGDGAKLADAINGSPLADERLKQIAERVRSGKNC